MRKLFIISISLILVLSLAYSAEILLTAQTVPIGNCGETDADTNLEVQYQNAGSIAGIFNYSGQIVSGVFTDYCVDPQILNEFVCGNSIGTQHSNLAGVVQVNCTELGSQYRCMGNACTMPPFYLIYDDFSGTTLNPLLWMENASGGGIIDEHFLSNENGGVYHTAQITPADKGVTLTIINYTFVAPKTVEFDLNYISGSGNRCSYLEINGQTHNYCAVGYWNGVQVGGNEFGTYHFNIDFKQSIIDVSVMAPNGTYFNIQPFPPFTSPNYTFGFGTRTGNDGIVHMDYDNVEIN